MDTTTARRRGNAWRLAGLVIGLGVAVMLASGPPAWLGLGQALAAPGFALCLLAGVILGELRPRPEGPHRTATLEVRDVGRYLPRALTRWLVAFAVILAALLVVTTAAGSPDDQGRPGRALAVSCGPNLSLAGGPWPGRFYSVPIGIAVLLGLGAALVTARFVAGRRRHEDDEPEGDEAARRRSTRIIVAAAGVLAAAPLAGCALLAGAVLRNVDCGGSWTPVLAGSCLALAGAATLGAAAFAANVLFPRA
jgi:hypothetical protein